MRSEFDQYAGDYENLVTEPVRTRFGGGTSDFFHARKMELLLKFLRKQGRDPSRTSWLDLGCGRGDLLDLGAADFTERAGCDPSEEMLSSVRPGLEIRRQSSPTTIPFDSGKFDLVTAVCVYHHVVPPDRVPLTAEIRRVLKPGGLLVIIEHNPLNPVTKAVVKRIPLDHDAQLLSARTAQKLVSAVGFRPLRTEYFLYFPKALYGSLGSIEGALGWLPLGGQYATFATNV